MCHLGAQAPSDSFDSTELTVCPTRGIEFFAFQAHAFFHEQFQFNSTAVMVAASARTQIPCNFFIGDRKSVREWRQVGICENSNDDGHINNMNSPVT
jgi:hypothetical protein